MARELLRLYALRESVKGFAFGKDTPWQHQFEDSFQYEETPDQLEATKEIKNDMEKQRPMDRLLCGDVGYGKTEVAIRAAFKAVMDGKQVAVLVPTTILAQQHYNTLKERFDGFPVRIAMTSRFLSQKEHNEVLKATSQGVVDILIGTHRMLGEGVRFKDLGLLIVDEEHRFGVGHKEEIKQLRANVDVLTLTATPIPRTLSMALSGLRDMSLIETPPEDRFPVQTYVLEASDELIRDAIMREVSRGGQVFYVHNRVQSIDRVAEHVSSLVPAVRIAVGHGQMKEDKLEQVMLDFISGEYDVLVCTTIIESGLDIPNANTLIVDDADHLGLAQLYQLRGRVGRSNRLAYAYFTYKREKVLTETSEKRLDAIREFTELGSGFKLAMRDLEIRGAGNVLGPEQHGFIMSVGYDLYVQLLEEAIRELRQEAVPKEKPQVSIDIPVDVYVPDDFVPSQRQKIELYKKVAAIESLEDADEVAEDILDRYGHPPVPVQNLLAVARVKVRARELGIVAISQQKERVGFKFGDVNKRRLEAIAGYLRGLRGRFTVSTTRTPSVIMRLESTKSALSATEQLLKKLCNLAL
jgi:transcription-repair coupling factor (superfamily II helicase)